MNIDPSNNINHLYTQSQGIRKGPQPSAPQGDVAGKSFEETLQLSSQSKLRQQPEIRPEMVEKGKELLNDPNFPSPEMINSIAKLIVPFDDK